jgi:hypothetical protein
MRFRLQNKRCGGPCYAIQVVVVVVRITASLLKIPAVYNAAKNNQPRILLGLA